MDSEDATEIAAELGELLIQHILDDRDLEESKALVEAGAPLWYQNAEEGISPLHAAAYVQNTDLVKFLIDNGAVWNAVDYLKNTAGDIALSFNNEIIYTLIRDAGIRSELVLGLLSKQVVADPASIILSSTDKTATGSSEAFLSSKLKYTVDGHGQRICMLEVDGEEVGVMMGWEEDIMRETLLKLGGSHPNASKLRVLNIGFGLGIIDTLFQGLSPPPREHVIIEAHPDVLAFMKQQGWFQKKGVKIFEGKWQDFVNSPEFTSGNFDIIYTDTFSESYNDLRHFFKCLPSLLSGPGSRFSFFNGLGATNPLFYDVYTRIAEVHLGVIGLDVEWFDVDVSQSSEQEHRWGASREYFSLPYYRMPIGRLKSEGSH